MNLIKAIKAIRNNKKALSNREGRFLTVYLHNGKRTNGKVLKPGYLSSTVQVASTGAVIKLKNTDIRFTIADHVMFSASGETKPNLW